MDSRFVGLLFSGQRKGSQSMSMIMISVVIVWAAMFSVGGVLVICEMCRWKPCPWKRRFASPRRQSPAGPCHSPPVPAQQSRDPLFFSMIHKPGEIYVWLYRESLAAEFIRSVKEMAANPELSLTAREAERLIKAIPKSLPRPQLHPQPRLDSPAPPHPRNVVR